MTVHAQRQGPLARYAPRVAPDDYFVARTWGWSSGGCRALSYDFAVDVEVDATETMAARLGTACGALTVPGCSSAGARYRVVDRGAVRRGRYALYHDGERIALNSNPSFVTSVLSWHVNHAAVTAASASGPVVHAAVAADRGVVVLMPAPMGSGKSTLVAGLVRAGFGYLTDEAAAVDATTLMVSPYPKPVSLERGSWMLFPDLAPECAGPGDRSWDVAPERIRPGSLAPAGIPTVIVFPDYQPAQPTRAIPVGRATALATLARSTFAFDRQPRRDLEVLGRLVRGCACYSLTVSDLAESIAEVARIVKDHHPEEAT